MLMMLLAIIIGLGAIVVEFVNAVVFNGLHLLHAPTWLIAGAVLLFAAWCLGE